MNPLSAPLVAVVTPVYNGGGFIERALASVQEQTYPNLLHVVLDNASTDRTPEIISRFTDAPKPLSVARNSETLDQVSNWNCAMSLVPSEARYVKLLCADDWMRPDAIEKLVAVAVTDPEIDYVGAQFAIDGKTMPTQLDPGRAVFPGKEFMRLALLGKAHWHPWAHMFFQALPEFLDQPFLRERFPSADTDFVFRMLMGRKVGMVYEPIYHSHRGEGTLTTSLGGAAIFEVTNFERMILYGRRAFDDEEFEREYANALRHILRCMLRWRLAGKGSLAASVGDRLARHGINVGAGDLMKVLAVWPVEIVGKRLRALASAA
jgi:glycosyltransferase involved in cell wall biosynthesis